MKKRNESGMAAGAGFAFHFFIPLVFYPFPKYQVFLNPMSKLRMMIGGAVILLMGIVLLFSSLGAYSHTRSFLKTGIRTDGVVGRLVQGYSPSIQYPVYGFKKPDGSWQQVYTDVVAKRKTTHQPGDKVELVYPPDNPGAAICATYGNLWGHAVTLAVSGAVSLFVGIGVLLIARTQ